MSARCKGQAVGRFGLAVVIAAAAIISLGSLIACAVEAPEATGGGPAPVPLRLEPTGSTIAGGGRTGDAYTGLAALVWPMEVFAPTVLPAGAMLAPAWVPVLESLDPPAPSGQTHGNPYVVGSGEDAEIQVVYTVGEGWLVVVENFRGDLGDVHGTDIGTVAGRPAALFSIAGGELVQWGKDGRWYGVFGRGVNRDVVVATALGMEMVSVEGW